MKKTGKILGILSIPVSIGIIATITTITVLRTIKGDFKSVSEVEISYVYGQGIQINGKATNSDVVFEFSKIDEENWTTEVPTYVGEYKVRGRSNGTDGYKYSKVQTFEITPLEINAVINESQVKFGSNPTMKLEGLVNGDSLMKDYVINYDSVKTNTTKANIVPESVHIFNKENEEVTECYNITYEEKDITFIPQEIVVSFTNESKQYDGIPLANDELTLISGNLYYDAHLEVSGGTSITDVGSVTNEHVVKVIDKDGDDVSENYNITIRKDNTLTINKIPLSISSGTFNKVYDGKPFENDVYVASFDETKLISGHKLECTFLPDKDLYKAGTNVSNSFEYTITDEDDNDVSGCYDVTTSFGTLTITKRNLKLTSNSINCVFDNQTHFDSGYIQEGELGYTDRIENTYSTFGPNVISTTNTFTYEIIHDDNGDIVTDCYNINASSGTVVISKQSIDVEYVSGKTYTYDGKYHPIYDLNDVVVTGLDPSYTFETSFVDENSNLIKDYKEGGYKLSENDFNVEIRSDTGDIITSNYKINYAFGNAMINKKDVTITTDDYSKVYDGKNITTDVSNMTYSYTDLADGDSLIRKSFTGTSGYKVGEGDIIFTYQIVDGASKDVSNNYNMDIKNGHYEITQREVNLYVSSSSKTYDGTNVISANSITLYADPLTPVPTTDTISIANTTPITTESSDVGLYEVTIDPSLIQIKHGTEDAKDNYYIVNLVNTFDFSIYKRNVTIRQIRNQTYFDGKEHGINNTSDYSISNLASGHKVEYQDVTTFTLPGEYAYTSEYVDGSYQFINDFKVVIKDAEDNDVTSNYSITYSNVTYVDGIPTYKYTILQKHIIVTSYDNNKPYDGTPLDPNLAINSTYHYYVDNGQTLDSGDTFTIEKDGERPTDVADSTDPNKNQFKYNVVIRDKQNNDVTDKYEITKNYGRLEVYKCNLNVVCKSASKRYGANDINFSNATFDVTYDSSNGVYLQNSDNVPANHHIVCKTTTEYESTKYFTVGTYTAQADIHLYEIKNGVDVDYNPDNINFTVDKYEIIFEVKKRSAKITTDSVTMTYNPKKPVAAKESRNVTGLASGDTIYFGNPGDPNAQAWSRSTKYYNSVQDKVDIGVYENEVGPYYVRHGNLDVKDCYDFEEIVGTITING